MRTKSIIGRFALLLTFLVSVARFAPADAAVFGRETAGTLASAGMSANFKRASKFTLTEPGVLYEYCLYVDGKGGASGSQELRFALYRDNNGVPGDLVLGHHVTGTVTVWEGEDPRWRCANAVNLPLQPGTYWLAIHSGGTPGVARYFYDGPANWYGAADVFDDGASRTFGSGGAGSGTISINLEYFPGTIRTFGSFLPPTGNPSSGMSADFKRGSSFVLPEGGQITRANVYLDGNGGATGEQRLRVAVYSDNNGVPGERVADSIEMSVYSGMIPSWITFYLTSQALPAGRYWVVLHTAGTPGVARYYLGGTGNWYGNADAYADGSSTLFGPGSPGNGTLAAWMVYERGTSTPNTFGRTDIATKPSSGMTADINRGSSFYLFESPVGVADALYAYMDGRGGGSGSQQVRLVMYLTPTYNEFERPVIASDVVTIPAGAPPGWVRFPIPYTYLQEGGYKLTIQSGQNAGVARYYIDGSVNNWFSMPDVFADGPESVYQPTSYGAGTISTYIHFTEFHPQ